MAVENGIPAAPSTLGIYVAPHAVKQPELSWASKEVAEKVKFAQPAVVDVYHRYI